MEILLLLIVLALVVLGILLWKSKTEVASMRQQIATLQGLGSDVGIIRTQLQNLPAALGDIGAVKSQVESVAAAMQDLGGIKSQVETFSGAAQTIGGIKSQVEAISQTVQQIGSIKADLENVRSKGDQLDETVRKIASKLIGARDVGEAGENLLAEAFSCFSAGWIERDFKVGGKVVEFALVLPNQKRLPIDSKFPAGQSLERLSLETDLQKRQEIIKQIETAVLSKAQEAAKYIDPSRTIHMAIAAIPDAAYSVCRKVHFQAIQSDVLVIPYSIALPVVLALYKFQLQYVTSIDQQNLEGYLKNIDSCLRIIEKNLENRIKDANTQINNAYSECIDQVVKIRASLSALRTPSLPAPEPSVVTENTQGVLVSDRP
ncbi:MAG: DNA recombination protein RmuC [Acidobacteria bacterium]|nr:DNA recombination protein RmuC [Acidobacteriota bacterium]